jgi:hypothetical protein
MGRPEPQIGDSPYYREMALTKILRNVSLPLAGQFSSTCGGLIELQGMGVLLDPQRWATLNIQHFYQSGYHD